MENWRTALRNKFAGLQTRWWEVVAAMVGGEKSAGDVQEHYVILLEDLLVIESGKLDNTLGEVMPVVLVECKESMCLSHDDTSS